MVAVFRDLTSTKPAKPDPHAAIRQKLGLAKTRRQPVTLAGSVQDSLPTEGHNRTRVAWGTSRYQEVT